MGLGHLPRISPRIFLREKYANNVVEIDETNRSWNEKSNIFQVEAGLVKQFVVN